MSSTLALSTVPPPPADFHHAEPGTDEPTWLLDPRWDETPSWSADDLLAPFARLVVLAAHPDDETLGVGGVLATAGRRGLDTHVVVATDGEQSHPHATTWTPAAVATVRHDEAARALRCLAPHASLHQLGLPDGTLARSLDGSTLLTDLLTRLLVPGTLLLTPFAQDGHPDHDTLGDLAVAHVGRAAVPRVALGAYPLWRWHRGRPDDLPWQRLETVDVDPGALHRKAGALACHRSQVEPIGPGVADEAVLGPHCVVRFERVVETLVWVVTPEEAGLERVRDAGRGRAATFDGMFGTDGEDDTGGTSDGTDDPWGFGSWYERRKRDLTLSTLPRERYERVLDVGCATGELTQRLLERAGSVTGVDVSGRALDVARRRLGDRATLRRGEIPGVLGDPEVRDGGPYDLVVLSEVGYFLTGSELLATVRAVRRLLAADGQVLLVHWRHPTSGIPLDGPTVHRQVASALGLPVLAEVDDRDVSLRVHGAPERSVARVEVVVPARDEESLLPRCLESLVHAVQQARRVTPTTAFGITVVLDRCEDDTPGVVRRAAERARWLGVRLSAVEVVEERATAPAGAASPPVGVGTARDVGARAALARSAAEGTPPEQVWLACTDADTVVPPWWLAEQVAATEQADLVLGTVQPDELSDPEVAGSWFAQHVLTEGHEHVHGANLGVRGSTYLEVGGFAPLTVGEDEDLAARVRAAGASVRATDRTRVATSARAEGRCTGGFADYLGDLARAADRP